jgi:Domain of unknown function (DUF4249)
MKKVLIFLISLKVLFFTNCIDKIDIDNGVVEKKLIVDGFISDLPGPYTVKLFNSLTYTSSDITTPVSGASVELFDDKGSNYRLKENFSGYYETDSASVIGVAGRSYYVKIRLANGKQYVSKPEILPKSVPIDTVYASFGLLRFNVSIQSKDPSVTENYYRWKWTHYRFTKLCLERFYGNQGVNYKEEADCCEQCWKFETPRGDLYVNADDIFNGKSFKQPVGSVIYNSTDPYFMLIEQQSLTKETYQFWKGVDSQIKNSGGIFDNPPALINGNIVSVDDPNEQVLGIFSAIGIARKPYYLIRDNVPNVKPIPTNTPTASVIKRPSCLPCKNSDRTIKKPFGWNG